MMRASAFFSMAPRFLSLEFPVPLVDARIPVPPPDELADPPFFFFCCRNSCRETRHRPFPSCVGCDLIEKPPVPFFLFSFRAKTNQYGFTPSHARACVFPDPSSFSSFQAGRPQQPLSHFSVSANFCSRFVTMIPPPFLFYFFSLSLHHG